MMKSFLVTVTTLALILLELLCGNRLLPMFFPLYGAVYFAVAYRKRTGIISAAAAGMLLDLLYCRPFMLLMFFLPAALLAALPVVKRFRRQLPLAPLGAGAVCGASGAVITFLCCRIYHTEFPAPELFSLIIFQTFTGAIFMLIFTSVSDYLGFKCNLPRFSASGNTKRRMHSDE